MIKTALTIAGSDSSGGAGIQADLKTMTAMHVYGMSAIVSLTAQNTTGVTDIMDVSPAFLKAQLDAQKGGAPAAEKAPAEAAPAPEAASAEETPAKTDDE